MAVAAWGAHSGCAQALRMRLADPSMARDAPFRWWCEPFAGSAHQPIIGIETPAGPEWVDQWLLSDQGVRRFRYRAGRLTAAGPPLTSSPTSAGFLQVRGWLDSYSTRLTPGGLLPTESLAQFGSMRRLFELMKGRWASAQIDPPTGLTPGQLAEEVEDFPHGIMDLAAMAAELGG